MIFWILLGVLPGAAEGDSLFSQKNNKKNNIYFSFNGIRMRTCYARPKIVYILSREDRLILRKESMGKFIFFPGEGLRQ